MVCLLRHKPSWVRLFSVARNDLTSRRVQAADGALGALAGKTEAVELINEVRGFNRVTYDVSSKPPATIEWK